MGHLIYTGSFAALELRWSQIVSALKEDDPLKEINVLVGSNILASYLKRRVVQNGRIVANIRFHTFLDLAALLSDGPGSSPGKPHLPRLGASVILEGILASIPPAVFAPLSAYAGFRDALLETFRDLRDAEISPVDLETAIQQKNRNPDRSENLEALADLYRRFRDFASLFHDVSDDFRSAIRSAPDARRLLGSRQLLVYGIYDVTGQQSSLLAALRHGLEMIYFIPFVHEAVSDFAGPFLEERVRELGVDPVPVDIEPTADSLGCLAARGFGIADARESGMKTNPAQDKSVALVSAPGESRAAVEVVREILRAIGDGTIRGFHEAAVILRQPENDVPILTEMLRLRGVPYFLQGGASFADRPVSKAVRALSGLQSAGFAREAVLAAMELVAAAQPETSSIAWDVQSWRVLTNEPQFIAGLQSWDEGVESLIGQARRDLWKAENSASETREDEDSEYGLMSVRIAEKRLEAAKSLREGWRILRQAAADWPAALPWKDWAHFLDRRLEPLFGETDDWPLFISVLDEISGLEALGLIRDSRFGIRDSATGALAGEPVSADRLRAALRQSMASLTRAAGRFQRSGVNLLSTSAARGLRFPLVIIPGLDEGRFPAKLRQDPLLLDSERSWMRKLPIKSRRVDEEKLLFDMAARSASKRLVLMTSRLDESSDRERIPSQFFLRAAAAIRGGIISMRELSLGNIPGFRSVSLDNPAPPKDEIAVDESEIRLRMVSSDHQTAQKVLEALAQLEPHRLRRSMAYDHARWNRKLTEYDGRLADNALIQWVAQKMGSAAGEVSASRLEEYAKCPYYFFLKRVVDLEPWEEPERTDAMDPLDRGLAVHSILEGFLKDFRGDKFQAESEEMLWNALEKIASEKLEKARPAGIPDLLWEIEREGLLRMLRQWLAFEKRRPGEPLPVTELERPFGEFGPQERYPAFRLKAGKHTFEFRGRIDRVDLSPDGKRARVVDYKTGTLPDSMAKASRPLLMSGEKIQIAVYRGALSVMQGFENIERVEGEYLHLQPKDARTVPCLFTAEQLGTACETLPGILSIVGDGIESGVFFARTRGTVRPSGHCEYCDFLTVCGKDRVQREERKANDEAVLKFLQILEAPL